MGRAVGRNAGWVGWWACMSLVIGSGCSPSTPASAPPQAFLDQCADLPGLEASHDSRLHDELARLKSERATPRQLQVPDLADLGSEDRPSWASRQAASLALVKLLTPQRRDWLLQRLDDESATVVNGVTVHSIDRVSRLCDAYAGEIQELRALLARRDFGLFVPLHEGLLADLTLVDSASALVRLECVQAARALFAGDLVEAEAACLSAARLIEKLAEVPHVVTRIEACRLRQTWGRTVQRYASHHEISGPQRQAQEALVARMLDSWPADADVLKGDRAIGLHTYELVRGGYALSILSWKELHALRDQQRLEPLLVHLSRHVDDDQFFYLRTMRAYIDACARPYYERSGTFAALASQQEQLRSSPAYPQLAIPFLLHDLEPAQRRMAADRALVEALHIALSRVAQSKVALDSPPPWQTHQVTGEPYQVEESDEYVEVSNVRWDADDSPVRIAK